MPKKFILKTFGNQRQEGNGNRPFERNLLNLSTIGLQWDSRLIKNIRTSPDDGLSNSDPNFVGNLSQTMSMTDESVLTKSYLNVLGNNSQTIAGRDGTYAMRRLFLRQFAQQPEIESVVETIADACIVYDDMHFFAYPNTKQLKGVLKPEKGKVIVDTINESYRRVYQAFNFANSHLAWNIVKNLLIDGFLAYEIIYNDTNNGEKAKYIIGFKALDPITLTPEIRRDEQGKEYKVWVVNKGEKDKERVLLDVNVIYISWSQMGQFGFQSNYSYVERLVRSFNMLRTIENSHLIWTVQNAQQKIAIKVPIGTTSEQMAMTRLNQLEAKYREDIRVNSMTGEVTMDGIEINANPNFSFQKSFIFPSREGVSTEISNLDINAPEIGGVEHLRWFYERFYQATLLPRERLKVLFGDNGNDISAIPDSNNMSREEYRFSLFIERIRGIYKEILLKPLWIQICLTMPEFSGNSVLKSYIGLDFYEDDIFRLSKISSNLSVSAQIIQTLSGLQGSDGKPYFSMNFLIGKYLTLSDEDIALNKKMKEDEEKEAMNNNIENQELGPGLGNQEPGGFGDLGGGLGDLGGGMTEPETPLGGGMEDLGPETQGAEEPTSTE